MPAPVLAVQKRKGVLTCERPSGLFISKNLASFATAQRDKCESAESPQDQQSWLLNSHGITRRIDNCQSEVAYIEDASSVTVPSEFQVNSPGVTTSANLLSLPVAV
jgi:hypothetical protein